MHMSLFVFCKVAHSHPLHKIPPVFDLTNSTNSLTNKNFEAGRRSRRNSTSDDSQLTIENFGGSQDQLNMVGRTMERERKISNTVIGMNRVLKNKWISEHFSQLFCNKQTIICSLFFILEPAVAVRSTLADARGSIHFGYDTDGSGSEKQDRDTEKPPTPMRRQSQSGENNGVSLRNITHSKEKDSTDGDMSHQFKSAPSVDQTTVTPVRKTSFATLPNTTTWQQQSANYQHSESNSELYLFQRHSFRIHFDLSRNSDWWTNSLSISFLFYPVDDDRPSIDATKLSTVRMKLEERRRHIEQEKRKIEVALSRQQQKVGKAAFLQAINKVSG